MIYPLLSKVIRLTPLRKILMGFALTVVSFLIATHGQKLIDVEQARFGNLVQPFYAAGTLDVAATCTAMRAVEQNASAQKLEAAGSNEAKVIEAIATAGMVVLKDGTEIKAQWPTVGWQLLAYVVITAAEVLVSITCLEFSYTQAPKFMKSLIMSFYLLTVALGNLFTAAVNKFTMDSAGNTTLIGADYYWFFTKLMIAATVLFIFVVVFYKPREYLQDGSDSSRGASA